MSVSNNFMHAMKFASKWEWRDRPDGMPTDDPDDLGGYTRFGLSQRAHPDLDIRTITLPGAIERYKERYWDGHACDELEMPKAIAVFDTYVNFSYATAKMLTRGECTWQEIVKRRKDIRGERVKQNPTQAKFLQGWLNRDIDLDKFCKIWEQDHE